MRLLTVIFNCALACGGYPNNVSVAINTTYASYQACNVAGLPYIKQKRTAAQITRTYTCHLKR